ncbi:MAG TPA: nuclear transport factor 2 family protein [Sphingobacteriaceae bacterium]
MDIAITAEEILKQEGKLYKAIKEGNVTALDELLHDDLLFIIPSGEVITKEMDLNTYRDEALVIDELQPRVENLNIIGDMAVITITMQLTGRYNAVPFDTHFRYIRFWKKFDDGIKAVGGSGVAISPA